MSAFANIKTYVASGADSFLVQSGIAAAELQVFFSTKEQERLLVLGADYAIEANGCGLQIHLLKPLCGYITLARVPDPCMVLQKFGVGMLPELNAWAERVASRLAYVESRLALTDARPIGSPECEPAALTLSRSLRMPGPVDDLCPPANGCYVLMFKDGVPSLVDPSAMAYMPQYVDADRPDYITLKDICNGAFDACDVFLGGVLTWVFPVNPIPLQIYQMAAAPEAEFIRCSSFDRIARVVICGISGGDVSVYTPLEM